jgi:hypothetical protein
VTETQATADIYQEKVFEPHVVSCLTTTMTGQTHVQTYAKPGSPERLLDALQVAMSA